MDFLEFLRAISPAKLVLYSALVLGLCLIVYLKLPAHNKNGSTSKPSAAAKSAPPAKVNKGKISSAKSKGAYKHNQEPKPGLFKRIFKRAPILTPEQGQFSFLRRTEPLTEFTHKNMTSSFNELVKRVPDSAARPSKDEDGLNALFSTMIKAGAIGHKKFLVTNYEHMYLEKLRHWFGFHYEIYCQVSVGSMVDINVHVSDLPPKERLSFAQKCHNMSFDFVLIEKATDRIVCAIELDDPTHLTADRKLRDQRLDKVCIAARIPIFHITNIYQKPDISRLPKE